MKALSYSKALWQYDDEQIRRLGELPAFQLLTQKYGSVREASEEELTEAFNRSGISEIEKALGITKERDDREEDWVGGDWSGVKLEETK